MSRAAKFLLVVGILVAVIVLVWWKNRVPAELVVQDAQARGIAQVTVRGVDSEAGSGSIERMTIEIRSTANTTVVIPVGTVFVSRGQGTQNMMSAQTVRVVFTNASATSPQFHRQEIPVYCINRWLGAPTSLSEFTVFDGGGGELDPVRKLAQCLETKPGEHYARQLAIWMVSDHLLNHSEEELIQETVNHDLQELANMSGAEVANRLRQMLPDVPDEVLARVRNASPDELKELLQLEERRPELEREAREEVAQYRQEAGPLLEACGYDLSTLRFFQNSR